jgi:hypothetical protein
MNGLINISFLKKISWKHITIFAGILAVAAIHSLVQLSFIQSENFRSAELSAQIENLKPEELEVETKPAENQIIDIEPREYKVRKVKVVTIPEKVSRRPIENVQPQAKKKVMRETRAARLRRAEKILTGV